MILPASAPRADFGGKIFPAPGEPEDVLQPSSFFPEDAEAGVDLADEGLKGSFLLPASLAAPPWPFSLGDLLPLLLVEMALLLE